jgi:hypothetical protein
MPLHRPPALGGVLLGLVLVTGGCGDPTAGAPGPAGLTGGWSTAGCEMSREPHATTIGDLTMPATPPELATAIERIERGGRSSFAESYAGLEVDQLAVHAVVYRVPSAAFDDFIRQSAANACIVVRDAEHSAAELRTWQEQVEADLDAWAARGVRIITVTSRHDGSGVELGVRDVAAAREPVITRYGANAPLILVEQGEVRPMPSGSATS